MRISKICFLAGVLLITDGCSSAGMVGSSADRVEAARSPAAGPPPPVVVSTFKVAAPKAKAEIGDGLQDMLSMALLRTRSCQGLEPNQDGGGEAAYFVTGALTRFEPSVGGVRASDRGNGPFASALQRIGVQSAEADAAEVGIDIRWSSRTFAKS